MRLELTDDEQIVAVCSRGKSQQPVPILDLTLPDPPPEGPKVRSGSKRFAAGRAADEDGTEACYSLPLETIEFLLEK